MAGQWLNRINLAIAAMMITLFAASGIIWLKNPREILDVNLKAKTSRLPKSSFEMLPEAYEAIDGSLLALSQASPSLQLPDLRQQLIYYGKNGRPDAKTVRPLLHIGLAGTKTIHSIAPEEPLYLVYEKKTGAGRYVFSPNNEKTSLWIAAKPLEGEAELVVHLANDQEMITEPENFHILRLPEKEFARYGGTSWELGSWRVDGTLLARQKARWYGFDRFLEKHGGEEFKEASGRQRIDLTDNDEIYSIFVKVGDCFIWDNRWKAIEPGADSIDKPLLLVKKIDERLMTLELWDVEGKGKVLLNLLKTTEPWMTQNSQHIQKMFRFVGARTKSQCVFEINQERMTMRPSDWLLLTNKGWKKITTSEEIDQYVKRKSPGTLFVFEGLSRKDEKQVMVGTLYNPSRSDCQTVELVLQPGSGNKKAETKENREIKEVADVLAEKGLHLKGQSHEQFPPLPAIPPMPVKTQPSNP
ncbi:MAG: hypothetical protein LW832_01905 [Parachlamydia sp.]|jgi:hypothetical protein|nr:hypothetical protein [Parachlamydia sp.]